MTDAEKQACISAVLLSLQRCDVSRPDQIAILAGALEAVSLTEQVDEAALGQMVKA